MFAEARNLKLRSSQPRFPSSSKQESARGYAVSRTFREICCYCNRTYVVHPCKWPLPRESGIDGERLGQSRENDDEGRDCTTGVCV